MTEFERSKNDNTLHLCTHMSDFVNELISLKKSISTLECSIKNLEEKNRKFLEEKFGYIDKSFYRLNSVISRNLSVADLHHATFAKFRCCNEGKSLVVVGSGPSLNFLNRSFISDDKVFIALNTSFLYKDINFDYLFMQDYSGLKDVMEDANNYRKGSCIKFYGLLPELYSGHPKCLIPESDAIEAGALRYRTDYVSTYLHKGNFVYDLLNYPFGDFYTVSLTALQFALWTYPKRIYLVGLDCTNSGHFDSKKSNILPTDEVVSSFIKFKEFAKAYYPHVEIISVNPVRLKGIFIDEFSEGFKESCL